MHFQNGNSTIKMSYILRVQATLYEEYKGGYMSKMRCISRYAVKIAVIVFIAILSTGCRSDDRKELELKEATVQEETTNPEKNFRMTGMKRSRMKKPGKKKQNHRKCIYMCAAM